MFKKQTMLKQMPSAEKKNYKKNNKMLGALFKEDSNKRLGIIICSCQEYIKH